LREKVGPPPKLVIDLAGRSLLPWKRWNSLGSVWMTW